MATSKKDLSTLGFLLIPFLAVVVRLIPGARTIDDAYITYRYVLNILNGQGMVFNPGEWVLGTTTPIYTFILSGLGLLITRIDTLDLPKLSCIFNALMDGIGCYVILLIAKKICKKSVGFLTAGVWAFAPFSVTFAIGGLETSLYVTLLLIIVYFSLTKHRHLTAIFSSMAFLTRPDAAILLGLIILERLFSAKRNSEKINFLEVFLWIAPATTWMVVSGIIFGNPFPHSIQAKMLAYHLGSFDGLIRMMQHFATPFLEDDFFGPAFIPFGLFLYPFLYAVGILILKRESTSATILMLFPLLYLIVFASANPLIFRWYLTPPTPFFIMVIFVGAQKIYKDFILENSSLKHSKLVSKGIATLLITLPILMTLSGWTLHPTHGPDKPAPKMSWIQLELEYQEAVNVIESQIIPSDTIAAADVGVIGYFSGVRILDTVGLNSPQSLDYYPLSPDDYAINYAIPTELIINEQPEWLIILEAYGRETLLKSREFNSRYQMVTSLDSDVYGSNGLLIFRLNRPIQTLSE